MEPLLALRGCEPAHEGGNPGTKALPQLAVIYCPPAADTVKVTSS
jgi:hypothetical protein